MPLYDCVVLLKPAVERRVVVEILSKIGRRVYTGNGVVTDVKSFGTINLAYNIKKRSINYNQGQMLQMSMMINPAFHKELLYLSGQSEVLRWILVRNKGTNWLERTPRRTV